MDVNFTLTDINKATEVLLKKLPANCMVIAFHGEMGAGKTTFIQELCATLKVEDVVNSPTFSIINEYHTGKGELIYHMDLYRLKSKSEAIDAGVEDCLYSGNLCLVEWPDVVSDLLPDNTLHCKLALAPNNSRNLQINL